MTVPLKLQVKIIYALAVELTVVTLADEDTSNILDQKSFFSGPSLMLDFGHFRHA